MSEYLLMWTLASVQPFIAAARKTQDLWIGSYLLSSLMEAALAAAQQHVREMVYPARTEIIKASDIADLPNTFVAHCAGADQARAAAQAARTALYDRWDQDRQRVWNTMLDAVPRIAVAHEDWQQHTEPAAILEIYWAAAPLEGRTYGETFKSLREALSDRKRSRLFPQLTHQGEKSTITGEQAALQAPQSTRQQVSALWQEFSRTSRYGNKFIRADGSERLGAIDCLKRFAASGPDTPLKRHAIDFNRFPSTSTIATATFLAAARAHWSQDQTNLDILALRWICALNNLEMFDPSGQLPFPQFEGDSHLTPLRQMLTQDGDKLFPATYTPRRIQREFGKTVNDAQQCTHAIDALQALIGAIRRAGTIAPPNPYVAVLMMDGDDMHKIIGRIHNPEEHKHFSEQLSRFAHEAVHEIVTREHLARLVYAGGDDVLLLTPVEHVLLIADRLRTVFSTTLSHFRDATGELPHASIGICIAHHQDPLSRTLRAARAAEQAAKSMYKRNSLVMTLLRRSGEQTIVGAPWNSGASQPTIAVLQTLLEHFREKRLSPKFAALVAGTAPALGGLPKAAQIAELKRLILRQWIGPGKPDEKAAHVLAGQLIGIGEALEHHLATHSHQPTSPDLSPLERLPAELRDDGPRRGIVEVSGWLSLLAFMAIGGRA